MLVIKRYANRKLYDTESKRYVTLEDLAELIRGGEEVKVVDHVTGDDLTSLTLLQVAFEEEKKIGGLLPQVFITRLIRAGGGTMNSLINRLSSFGSFQAVEEEIRRRILALEEQGSITAEESLRWQDLLVRQPAQTEPVQVAVRDDESPEAAVETTSAAQQPEVDPAEVDLLVQQVDQLEQELAQLRSSGAQLPPTPR